MTIKVDLLPTEKKQFGIDPAMILMFILIIAAVAGMFLYSNSLANQIKNKQAEIEKIDQDIKQIETQLPLIEETKTRIASIKREIKMIKSLVHDPLRYANLLQEVAILLPENVWLTDLAIDPRGNKVTFNGRAAEVLGERKPLATIADLMRNFNDSEYFTNSTLSSTSESASTEGEPSVFQFSLSINYDPEKAATEPPTGMGANSVPTAPEAAVKEATSSDDSETESTASGTPTPSATATP